MLKYEIFRVDAEYSMARFFYREANQHGLVLPQVSHKWHDRLLNDNTPWSHLNEEEWIPRDLAEVIALMQHYGFPTRMLDWSQSILTALYFAASGAVKKLRDNGETDEHMVLWILNKTKIEMDREKFGKDSGIRFITPSYANNPNLNAQKGILTYVPINKEKITKILYPSECMPIDKYIDGYYSEMESVVPTLVKVKIPMIDSISTLSFLDALGVNATSQFPGYASLYQKSNEIRNRYVFVEKQFSVARNIPK